MLSEPTTDFRSNGATQRRPVVGVIPGEGIGPEVVPIAVSMIRAASRDCGAALDVRFYGGPIGAASQSLGGHPLPQAAVEFCESVFCDRGVLLCGPGGGRFVYDLRRRFDLFCKQVPIRPLEALRNAGVVREAATNGVDLLVVRENCGGMYYGTTRRDRSPDGMGTCLAHTYTYTSDQIRRILQVAIQCARSRRRRLALVVKPSGIPELSDLWTESLRAATDGDDLEIQVLEIDNACYQVIAQAHTFDVIVAPNLFGDVLADCAALLLGSRGMSLSGNFSHAGGPAVFQTGHGAARDLVGRDVANPLGQVLSAAMLLREGLHLPAPAAAIEAAIAETLAAGFRTADVMAPGCQLVGTRRMGELLLEALERAPACAPAAT